jgi:hypothetical protein
MVGEMLRMALAKVMRVTKTVGKLFLSNKKEKEIHRKIWRRCLTFRSTMLTMPFSTITATNGGYMIT